MKTIPKIILLLLSVILFVNVFSSCRRTDQEKNNVAAPDPMLMDSKIIGTYTGFYKKNGRDTIVNNNQLLVIGEKIKDNAGVKYTTASIQSLSYIIKIDNLAESNGQISGVVKLYDDPENINVKGKEIAGYGSFNYSASGKVTILWTANLIYNEGWNITFQSN